MSRRWALVLIAIAAVARADPPPPALAPELQALAAEARFGAEVPVIIRFADEIDPRQFRMYSAAHERRHRMLVALRGQSQDGMRSSIGYYLRLRGARDIKPLWLSNSIAATLPAVLLNELARWPIVARVRLDAVVRAPTISYDAATPAEWNIQALRAHEVWNLGYRGQGVTVAIMDSGVDVTHPDLRAQYRGGSNSWFDPYGEHAAPYDPHGHGTRVAGIVFGRNASPAGNVIGVAPDVQWIAAKIFNDQDQATLSAMHEVFQWLLDPDGDPASNDAPDLVNASWGLEGGEPCSNEFERDVQALRAAGIGIVFSAGNSGPGVSSTVSPGNNAGVLSVAAVDAADDVALFSSRGPSACDGGGDPELAAPGVSVFTSDTSFGLGSGAYAYDSGTSFAAPHVTGVLALMWSARPTATFSELETVVLDTARDLGTAGPDFDTGHGMPDAFAAVGRVLGSAGPIVTRDTATTAEDTPIAIDVLANDLDPGGAPLTVAAVASPTPRGGTVVRNADYTLTYTPAANFNGTDSFSYTVSNGSQSNTGSVVVSVLPVNDAPVASDDPLVLTADAAGSYTAPAPGVLANDSDVDGDALSATLVSGVATGTLQLRPDGSFSYSPPAGGVPPGTISFSYRVSDGVAAGNVATVTVTLNRAPLAADDAFTLATPDASGAYAVASPGVLANDSDPDGNPLGASLVTNVVAGTVQLLPGGGFSYTPPVVDPPRTLSFSYRAGDGHAASNVATVNLTVNRVPRASDDRVQLTATGSGSYTLAAPGILANDTDPDRDPLTPELVRPVAAGLLTLDARGALSYTPPASGVVPSVLDFTYRVRDATAASNVATATLSLASPAATGTAVSMPPVAMPMSNSVPTATTPAPTADMGVASEPEAASAAAPSPSPPDNARREPPAPAHEPAARTDASPPLAVHDDDFVLDEPDSKGRYRIDAPGVLGNDRGDGRLSAVLVHNTRAGKVTLAPDGGFTYMLPTHGAPEGELSFSYKVQNGASVSDTATVTLSFRRPLVAQPDRFTLSAPDANGEYHVTAPGVLGNDTGPGGLRALLVQDVTAGRLKLAADGGFRYTPPPGGVPGGPVSFTYKAASGKLASRAATVVFALNPPLAAHPDRFTLAARDARGRYVLPGPGVLANDTGSGALTAIRTRNVAAGSVALAPTGGFTYTPPPGGAPAGPLEFHYRVSDGQHNSREASVTFSLAVPAPKTAEAHAPDRKAAALRSPAKPLN
jgi:subtilisin family serine protease